MKIMADLEGGTSLPFSARFTTIRTTLHFQTCAIPTTLGGRFLRLNFKGENAWLSHVVSVGGNDGSNCGGSDDGISALLSESGICP